MLTSRASAVGMAAFLTASLVLTGQGASTSPATGAPSSSLLGLPALSTAQKYVLAPATRTVRPARVVQASRTNEDFVTASSATSESDAHGLLSGTSRVATVGGVKVRQAGVGLAGGAFSYQLTVRPHEPFTLRVEEAGSSAARYDVLVNGHRVHSRTQALYAAQSRPIGLTSYRVSVPRRLVTSGSAKVTFRNADNPGDGAQIAAVWANALSGKTPSAQFGGRVTTPIGAAKAGSTRLSSNFFGKPYVIYDFGRAVQGKVRLDASHVRGAPRLGLAFSESKTFMTTTSDFSQDPSGVATETHYFPLRKKSVRVADPVIRGSFRYLMVFLDSPGSATLSHLAVRFTGDPGNPDLRDYAGSFLSSDDQLNQLWYAGAYTVQMSTIGSHTGRPYPAQAGPVSNDATVAPGNVFLSDGAKRDRLDWGGDNTVSGVVSYLTTGEHVPARNSIEWFGDNPSPQGQVPGVYLPSTGFQYSWGEYAGWWATNYWNYFLYTGDTTFLEKYYPTLVDNLAWFQSHVDSDDLLDVPGDASGHWGYAQTGKEAYDNIVLVQTLQAAAKAARAMGMDDDATRWTTQAERTSAAVNDTLWDADAGAYVALPGSTTHPLDANALAVTTGVADATRSASVLDFIEANLRTPYGEVTADNTDSAVPDYISPFVSGLELEAYHAAGDTAGQLSVMRRTWGHMLKGANSSGTLWETVGPDGQLGLGSYTSMAHGWAAAPTLSLTTQVLGVTPTSGGFATFDVTPTPLPGLTWAQGSVPTPDGDVRAAWKRSDGVFKLRVEPTADATYSVTVPATADDDVTGVPAGAVLEQGATTATVTGLTGPATITVTSRG